MGQGVIDNQPARCRTHWPAVQPLPFKLYPSVVQLVLSPLGLAHKLVERTLIIFVKEQIIDRGNRRFITGDQAGHVLAEMLALFGGLKHRRKVS